ncbi:hypothetical protein VNO77_33913 [Canavalia gladiata]|uniref:Uncharacterized protein n=1 Tax=Canavalia gladiata TaxID=3824 RepID=A0AAN9KF72_CANGL
MGLFGDFLEKRSRDLFLGTLSEAIKTKSSLGRGRSTHARSFILKGEEFLELLSKLMCWKDRMANPGTGTITISGGFMNSKNTMMKGEPWEEDSRMSGGALEPQPEAWFSGKLGARNPPSPKFKSHGQPFIVNSQSESQGVATHGPCPADLKWATGCFVSWAT